MFFLFLCILQEFLRSTGRWLSVCYICVACLNFNRCWLRSGTCLKYLKRWWFEVKVGQVILNMDFSFKIFFALKLDFLLGFIIQNVKTKAIKENCLKIIKFFKNLVKFLLFVRYLLTLPLYCRYLKFKENL